MPTTPASLTITEVEPNSGAVELEWPAQTADRFEVLRKESGSDIWVTEVLAPASDFGAGPFTYRTSAQPTTTFVVRALDAAGAVST